MINVLLAEGWENFIKAYEALEGDAEDNGTFGPELDPPPASSSKHVNCSLNGCCPTCAQAYHKGILRTERSWESVVVYGDGGFRRYYIQFEGTVVFSARHCSNSEVLAKARELGFQIT